MFLRRQDKVDYRDFLSKVSRNCHENVVPETV